MGAMRASRTRRRDRHHIWRRRLSALLIVAGIALLLTPVFHSAYAWAQQELMLRGIYVLGRPDVPVLVGEPDWFELNPTEPPDQVPPPAGGSDDPAPAPEPPPAPKPTGPAWRLEIPRLNVNAIMVYGTEPSHLAKGPGVFTQGSKPGEPGNISIAAHRNAYGRWFRHLDKMQPGDEIRVWVDETAYTYIVEWIVVIVPTDWSVVAQTDYDAVTLITCHPYGSTTERLVVRGRLQ